MRQPKDRSLLYSIVIHSALVIMLFVSLDFSTLKHSAASASNTAPVKAVALNEHAIQQALANTKRKEAERIAKERARERQLAAAAEKARRLRAQEEMRLAQLKAAQAKAKIALAKQKIAAEKLKQQQAAAQKHLAEMKAAAAAEAKQHQVAVKKAAELKKAEEKKKLAEAEKVAKEKLAKIAKLKAQQRKLAEELMDKQLAQEAADLQRADNQRQLTLIERYKNKITHAIGQHWLVPETAQRERSCKLHIQVGAEGAVLSVKLLTSSGDAALDRSAVAAVYKASPLPVPTEPGLFEQFQEFNLTVKPEEIVSEEIVRND